MFNVAVALQRKLNQYVFTVWRVHLVHLVPDRQTDAVIPAVVSFYAKNIFE